MCQYDTVLNCIAIVFFFFFHLILSHLLLLYTIAVKPDKMEFHETKVNFCF